jgi:catechol 2,3-dioxygenase-like lactoylglutathione lyase family enzyme
MHRVFSTILLVGCVGAAVTVTRAQQSVAETSGVAGPALVANRVILRVSDLNKSIAFYRDQVGLPLQATFDEFAVLGGGGATVMLQQLVRKSSGPSTGLASFTEIVLESPDVFASYRSLRARGIEFRREPSAATTDGSRVLYAADFRDPDGHVLSITGWVDAAKR